MKKLETQVFVGNTVTNTAKTELITVRSSLSSIQQKRKANCHIFSSPERKAHKVSL